MGKNEYLKELKKYLKKLPKNEFQEVMEYYEEYFDEAGPEREYSVIEEIGSPKQVAHQVLQNLVVKYSTKPIDSVKSGFSATKIVFLWILAAPLALPLLLAGIAVVFALFLTVSALALALIILGGSFVFTGVVSTIVSFFLLFSQVANGIAILGIGLLLFGIGIPATYCFLRFSKFLFTKTITFIGNFINRRTQNEI